jgi:hypothetical protein
MPKNRSAKDRMMLPGTIDRVVVDTFRGQYRVRKWPKKRGTPTDPVQLERIRRFAEANKLAKFVQGAIWIKAMKQAAGTGLYPRDVLVQAMLTGQADIAEANGDLISYKRWYLEAAVFQGARVERLSNNAYVATAAASVSWQTPVIQTVPIWSVGQPTRLTVPTGVNIVRISLATRATAVISGWIQAGIRKNGVDAVAATNFVSSNTFGANCDTGPIYVAPGDYFEARIQGQVNYTLGATPQTFFAMEILGTTI